MSCRHAFHRTCVDEWLQTGRNNCPACRTTVRPKKKNFFTMHICLMIAFLGRDDWHRQLHILISYIKNQSFLAVSSHEPKKYTSPSSILAMRSQSSFFSSLVISDPCSGSTFLLVIFCNGFSPLPSYTQSQVIYTPTTRHSFDLFLVRSFFFLRFGLNVVSE